uniref:Uncharacterized protein n=1 Tax=Strigamia maritima TaxID=126957 RepID=T1J041_STRMM
MLRILIILLVSVSIYARLEPEKRRVPMMNVGPKYIAEGMVGQAAGKHHRRSQDPLVDALLLKRIENTFNDIDHVLDPARSAREEASTVSSIFSSILSTFKMLRILVIFLISVSVCARPEPQERRDPMVNIAGDVMKSMAGSAAKNIAEGMVDQAANIFDIAQSAGKNLQQMWQSSSKVLQSELDGPNEDQNQHGYKFRRSQNTLVDALLRKRIENTFKDIDNVLEPARIARDDGSSPMSVISSVLVTVIKLLEGKLILSHNFLIFGFALDLLLESITIQMVINKRKHLSR